MSQQIGKLAAGIGAFDGAVTVHDQRAVAVIQKCGIQNGPEFGIQKCGYGSKMQNVGSRYVGSREASSGSEGSRSEGSKPHSGQLLMPPLLSAGGAKVRHLHQACRGALFGFRGQLRFFGGLVPRTAETAFLGFFLVAPALAFLAVSELWAYAAVRRFRSTGVAWRPRCWLAARSTSRAAQRHPSILSQGAAARLGIDKGGQRFPVHVSVPARIQLLIR